MPSTDPRFPNVRIYDHPLIQHKLTIMRDKRTGHEQFRQLLNQVTGLMAYDVCRNLPVRPIPIETPITKMDGTALSAPTTIVPILRAVLVEVLGFGAARFGHRGMAAARCAYCVPKMRSPASPRPGTM